LNQAQIITAIGQSVATAMAQHVRMDMKGQPCALAGDLDQVVDGRARKRIPALIEKQQPPQNTRRNALPVELIDGAFLMCHEHLAGALV
jgi:hypothetical protein